MQLLAKFKIILYMRFFKLYVNFFEFGIVSRFNLYAIAGINSTELVNEFTTEDDR